MSDFTDFKNFGAITPELLIRSLLSGINALDACGIRVKEYAAIDEAHSVHTCTTPSDFIELFKKALVMADDNKVAIRVLRTDSANGVGLDTCQNCINNFTIYELLGSFFVADSTGAVYLNIANIT